MKIVCVRVEHLMLLLKKLLEELGTLTFGLCRAVLLLQARHAIKTQISGLTEKFIKRTAKWLS